MTDVAALGISIDSSQIKEATLALKAMPNAASAAERAAQRWGMAHEGAGQSAEAFSKRAQKVVRDLEFETAQLSRGAAEKERFNALRRAGVAAASLEGQAISASVAALQAQRGATGQASGAISELSGVADMARNAFLALGGAMLIGKFLEFHKGVQQTTGALIEQADSVGLSTDALQAYRAAASAAGTDAEKSQAMLARFNVTLGDAKAGGEEAAKAFIKLKVPILDMSGNVRDNTTLLTESARALLNVKDVAERAALAQVLFSRNGAQSTPVLREWAKGADALAASAREAGLVVDRDVAETFNKLSRQSEESKVKIANLYAQIAAPIEASGLSWIARQFQEIANSIALVNTHRGTLDQIMEVINVISLGLGGTMVGASATERALRGIADAENAVVAARRQLRDMETNTTGAGNLADFSDSALAKQRNSVAEAEANLVAAQNVYRNWQSAGKRPTMAPRPSNGSGIDDEIKQWSAMGSASGAAYARPKGQADAYQKIIDGAKQYVAMKNIETQALGMNAEAAARLKHEQELLGKATEGGITLGAAQTAQLKALAAAMAEADSKFKTAKFMDDATDASRKFIAAQEIERQTLFMSAEAAMAYRIEQELLTKAANDNITVTAGMTAEIQKLAQAQAAAAEKTRVTKEWVDLGKETFRGFFSDINQGLREGANIWDTFGNAATNALNRIGDKLLQMATDKLFEAAFGGASGSGGGGLFGGGGGILNFLGLGGGTASSSSEGILAGITGGGGIGGGIYAKGAAFSGGNVIPFANGGVTSGPTYFGMSGGRTGLMGEAGKEGVLPLRRGRGGRLGVEASGAAPAIYIEVAADSEWVRATARDESGRVIASAAPGIEARAVNKARDQVVPTMNSYKAERGGDYRG